MFTDHQMILWPGILLPRLVVAKSVFSDQISIFSNRIWWSLKYIFFWVCYDLPRWPCFWRGGCRTSTRGSGEHREFQCWAPWSLSITMMMVGRWIPPPSPQCTLELPVYTYVLETLRGLSSRGLSRSHNAYPFIKSGTIRVIISSHGITRKSHLLPSPRSCLLRVQSPTTRGTVRWVDGDRWSCLEAQSHSGSLVFTGVGIGNARIVRGPYFTNDMRLASALYIGLSDGELLDILRYFELGW